MKSGAWRFPGVAKISLFSRYMVYEILTVLNLLFCQINCPGAGGGRGRRGVGTRSVQEGTP